ncbi:hypothetical protein PORCAN_810 [Porphyromonas crevioricanis JCM 13913]|nr:hypothetical protein PORCAN_810 [Porphyromonas crevioricanis JCM 13913]
MPINTIEEQNKIVWGESENSLLRKKSLAPVLAKFLSGENFDPSRTPYSSAF